MARVALCAAASACTVERAEVRRPPRSAPVVSAEDSANVRGTVLSFAEALEDGDLIAMERRVDPGVVVFESGRANYGWADFRDNHLAPELATLRDRRFDVDVRDLTISGDAAWVTFDYRLRAESERGPVSARGLGTAVLDRRGGVWAITHLHLSSAGEAP